MKKLFCIVPVLSFVLSVSAQQNPQPVTLPDNNNLYLKKSKNQQKAAWICLGGGFALTSTGLIIGLASVDNEIASWFSGENNNSFDAGAVLFYAGIPLMLTSIPLFIASAHNKKRSLSAAAFLKWEEGARLQNVTLLRNKFPALGLRLNF